MTPEAEFNQLFTRMYELCEEQEWGDPFSYARYGNQWHVALPQVYPRWRPGKLRVGYKSPICASIVAIYNGISTRPTWEEQVKYLKDEIIAKYTLHVFFREDGEGEIKEIWEMESVKVYELLLPKLKKQYFNTKRKEWRLGASLSAKEIENEALLEYFTDSDSSFS